MRLKSLFAALAAIVSIGFGNPEKASAFFGHDERPAGWGHARAINHYVYYPRYVHNYHVDPYAYRYSPRGYYPYSNAGYWRPAHVVRDRNHKHYNHWNVQAPRYKYFPSWGGPNSYWHHHGHYGRHHRWHR